MNAGIWSSEENMNEEDNIQICKPFEEVEIKHAVFSRDTNKDPGPCSIPIGFFQKCWEIVKEDMMKLFQEFYDGKLDIKRLNYGIITLLHKTKEAHKIKQ